MGWLPRRLRYLIPLAAFALVAAACGGDEGDGAAPEPADLSGETVEVAAVWTGTEQDNFTQVLDEFESQTGATVTYTSTGDDIATVLGTRIEGGDPPDVALLPQPGLMFDLHDQGALQAIDDVAGDEVDANYAEDWRNLGSIDGTLYGVWFKAANKSTVWYNVTAVENAGVTPPETWDDLLAASQTVADSGVTPWSVAGADGWTLTDWFENIYIRTAGGDMYDQLTNHEIPWTDPSVKDALATMAEVMGESDWLAGGTNGALQTDFPTSVTQVYQDPPAAAMVYEGDFVAGVIGGETGATLGTDANFFTFPSIGGSTPAIVGGGDVAVLLKDSDGGKAMMEFLASPAAAEIWAGLGGFTSPNQNVDLSVYPDDITRASAEALTQAEAFRFDMSDLQPAEFGATVGQGLFKLFQDFLKNPADIDGVTQKMEDAAAKAFG